MLNSTSRSPRRYLANEERTKAIAELEKATELNPEFKAQADYYIGEIRAGRNP